MERRSWWWLTSNPGKLTGLPVKAYGPFATPATVPAQEFLASNHFSHAGTWNVLGRSRDAFSAALNDKQAATWYWFDSGADRLARIMNIRTENDFQVAVLGAYYLVDFGRAPFRLTNQMHLATDPGAHSGNFMPD